MTFTERVDDTDELERLELEDDEMLRTELALKLELDDRLDEIELDRELLELDSEFDTELDRLDTELLSELLELGTDEET